MKIKLKPNSVEYADGDKPTNYRRHCEMPGCNDEADFRAPKDRELEDYYWFCYEHVSEYNKAWNYFTGMTDSEVEDFIVRSALWDRPTQKINGEALKEQTVYRQAWKTYHYTDKEPEPDERERTHTPSIDENTPEAQALKIMDLTPPLSLDKIKSRYKELAKKYHPDLNGGSKEAEEQLKTVNMSYTILKIAFEKYERFEKLKNQDKK